MSENQQQSVVLIAHEDETCRSQAAALLRAAGFEVVAVCDGGSARIVLRTGLVRVLLADVALRAPTFYELCQYIAADQLSTRVLIVSSVHSSSAYKRAPTELYGADGIVEGHRLAEDLVARVREMSGF